MPADQPPTVQLTDRFHDALAYASRLHVGQARKGSLVPYVSHLLGVASLVLEGGGDEDQAIAALLHDAVEDQGGLPRLHEIRERFGERVAHIVDGCTDSYADDHRDKLPWRERKVLYLARLQTEAAEVRLVSVADKLHNARSIVSDLRDQGSAFFDRFTGGRDGTLWYYRSLVETYAALPYDTAHTRELARTVAVMEQLAEA